MTYNISIWFRDFRDNGKAVFQNVEKVEVLPVGRGILSVIKDGKNKCFLLDTIDFYEIDDVVNGMSASNIDERDCDNCIHYKQCTPDYGLDNVWMCEKWTCEFEPRKKDEG